MMKHTMFSSYLVLVYMVTVVFGCSPPEGGFIPPTPAQKVNFAEYVVVGEVKSLLEMDPLYGDSFKTYGAKVFVQCSYKGDALPGMITIGGAGFIPGRCTSKDVKAGNKYILFLSKTLTKDNETVYEQTEMPDPSSQIMDFLDVCDVKMLYPEENDMPLKRKVCEYQKDGPCQFYNADTNMDETRAAGTTPTQIKKTTDEKEVVSVNIGNTEGKTEQKGENGSSGLSVSFGLFLLSFLSVIV